MAPPLSFGVRLKMSILQNAIDSIVLGLEDFESSDHKRIISCVRNLFAGILLLFKYKLVLLSLPDSNEVLIKQEIVPVLNSSGSIFWKGKGKKTVNVYQIKERFKSLGIDVDWNRIEKINSFRNDIEHYYSRMPKKAIESVISDSFIIIRDFISIHLQKDPRELLGEKAWNTLLKVSEVYKREKQECIKKIEQIDWQMDLLYKAIINCQCELCGSDLITVHIVDSIPENNKFVCRACGEEYNYETIIKIALEQYSSRNYYFVQKYGEEPEVIQCPFCGELTYIYHERQCALCGEKAEHKCQRCGITIPPEEINEEGFCSWCLYMMSKDD